MLPPLATGTTGHTVSGQAQNTTPPSQPHATLRPAEWNDRNPSPPSPADKKRYACEVCDKRFERYAENLIMHAVADLVAGRVPSRLI